MSNYRLWCQNKKSWIYFQIRDCTLRSHDMHCFWGESSLPLARLEWQVADCQWVTFFASRPFQQAAQCFLFYFDLIRLSLLRPFSMVPWGQQHGHSNKTFIKRIQVTISNTNISTPQYIFTLKSKQMQVSFIKSNSSSTALTAPGHQQLGSFAGYSKNGIHWNWRWIYLIWWRPKEPQELTNRGCGTGNKWKWSCWVIVKDKSKK